MAGVPEMWRNQGNIYSRNTTVPPYCSEKQLNGKNPAEVLTSTVNESELVSFCLPKNNLKPVDKQTLVSSDTSGSGEYSSNSKQDTIGGQQCNPVNIRLCNFLKQQHLTEKASPSLKGYKYVHDDFVALPYWKHADKDDPPVRTLFRAKKWIDSDEQGCKRVNCVVECEKIDSKYCSCSRKRIGVSVVRRNSVSQPCHDSVSSCFDQRKQENIKLIIGDKVVKNSEISGSCQFWNVNNNGQVQYFNGNDNGRQSHNQRRVSFNECDLETIKVATVQSSKCVYLKHSGGSYIPSNNKVLLQNPSCCVPNVVHDRPSSTPTKLMAPNLREVSGRMQRVKLCNLDNSNQRKYPIDSRLLTEPGNVMGDHANNSGERRQKPEWAAFEGTLKREDDSKLEDSNSQSIKKKPKTVLDVLEVDTLAKANNILEKIACTLDQIKVLNQSTDIHESKKQIFKMEGENLKIEESVKDKGNLELAYNGDKKRKKNCMNIFTENEASIPAQNEGKKLERSMTEKMCGDAHMMTVDNVELKKDHPSIDNGSDDLNAIPLKITKAVSAFKTVETSAVYSCKLYATQDLQGNHDTKKSHSINILGQVEVDQKRKIVNSLLEMSPDHKVSGESKTESFNPQSKAIPFDKAVNLVSPSSPKMKNLKKSLNEGIDQKKMTTVALQSVLKTAISPRTSSMKDSCEYSMKGDEDRSDSTRNKATANQSQPTALSRIISLAQPKVRYIKALKTEYQNVLDKPTLERLERLIEPMEKLQSSMIANSKPPAHPSRNPSPRKTGIPVGKKIAEGDQKPNCTPTDACLKKTQLRPKTTPNKARDATVPQRGLTATPAAESSKNKMKNGSCTPDVGGRPVTVSGDHQSQGSRVSWAPSPRPGERENETSQLDGLAKVRVGSRLPTVHEYEQSGRKRSQSFGEPVRLGLSASEGNAGERESYECLRNQSLIDNLEDEPLPSKRLRARSCVRRKEKIRPRRRRFTTCCLMPSQKYFLADSLMSNNSEEPKNPTDSKKQYADASVNVSLTLKSENMDASVQKTEEVLVNSSQEGNNQIIFNVYQMAPKNLASDRKDECSDRKGQLREENGKATQRLEEDISNATSQDQVESSKSHVEILVRPGMTDIRGYDPCSSPIYTTGGACGEGGPNRGQIEEPFPKRYIALPCSQDGRNPGELWGNGERLVLTTELPQYVPCQGHLGSLEKGRLPFPVRNIVCECCGRDGTSNVSQVVTSFSYAEPRAVSSAPSLEVSDSYPELCIGCRRIMKTLPNLKIRKGRPLVRPLKELSSKVPHAREPVRCQGKYREESLHLSQPLGDLSLGMVRDWLRDSNVDLRRWSSELTVKVDVGTSVSRFHVANLHSGGTHINREAMCATNMEVDRKDVACSTKTSSVTVILEKKYFKLGQCMTEKVTSNSKKKSKVTPCRTLARVPNTCRRKILAMTGVYVCLLTFFGWVLLLPSYYIK